jgi:DNA-directed RNA polymerase specialized sigma24 family protein
MAETETKPFTWDDVVKVMVEIRVLAKKCLAREIDQYSWRPTALLDEALTRLCVRDQRWSAVTWQNKEHFFKACRMAMKSALEDRRRYHKAQKRPRTIPLELALERNPEDLVEEDSDLSAALQQAIDNIAQHSDRVATLLEYRFVLGMSVPEAASVMNIPERTARRLWAQGIDLLEAVIQEETTGHRP